MTAAESHLQKLISDIRSQQPKTLAFWRLSDPVLVESLEEFAKSSSAHPSGENSVEGLLDQTQTLFDKINPILGQQEAECDSFVEQRRPHKSNVPSDQIAVVFGGKFAPSAPQSISELLVSKLTTQCPHVLTVSRSKLDYPLPSNVVHISKLGLDQASVQDGKEEFSQVIEHALELQSSTSRLVLFFTLGQHKGENPFVRNVQAAENFAQALVANLKDNKTIATDNWRVVLTGTDATLPSTHPDDKILISPDIGELVIPSYKIMKYNYTYAMSKLGQYYIISHAVAQLVGGNAQLIEEIETVVDKIRNYVQAAGEDGAYHDGDDDDAPPSSITMSELDQISRKVDTLLIPNLKQHLTLAQGISICYTPLHARPWTEQALKQKNIDPKAFILEQVIKRFKNAVSIEHAVLSHLSTAVS